MWPPDPFSWGGLLTADIRSLIFTILPCLTRTRPSSPSLGQRTMNFTPIRLLLTTLLALGLPGVTFAQGIILVPHTNTHYHLVPHGNHAHLVPHTTTHFHTMPVNPGMVRGYPGTFGGYPGTIGGYPGTIGGYPGTIGGYPGTIGGYPSTGSIYPAMPGGTPSLVQPSTPPYPNIPTVVGPH